MSVLMEEYRKFVKTAAATEISDYKGLKVHKKDLPKCFDEKTVEITPGKTMLFNLVCDNNPDLAKIYDSKHFAYYDEGICLLITLPLSIQ